MFSASVVSWSALANVHSGFCERDCSAVEFCEFKEYELSASHAWAAQRVYSSSVFCESSRQVAIAITLSFNCYASALSGPSQLVSPERILNLSGQASFNGLEGSVRFFGKYHLRVST